MIGLAGVSTTNTFYRGRSGGTTELIGGSAHDQTSADAAHGLKAGLPVSSHMPVQQLARLLVHDQDQAHLCQSIFVLKLVVVGDADVDFDFYTPSVL